MLPGLDQSRTPGGARATRGIGEGERGADGREGSGCTIGAAAAAACSPTPMLALESKMRGFPPHVEWGGEVSLLGFEQIQYVRITVH